MQRAMSLDPRIELLGYAVPLEVTLEKLRILVAHKRRIEDKRANEALGASASLTCSFSSSEFANS